jgi:uncharacterized protein
MDEMKLEILKREAEKLMPRYGTHGFEHILRVYHICRKIGISTGADLSVLLPAALLHDIARDEVDHAYASSVKAGQILYSQSYPEDEIEAVVKTISSHSFTGGRAPDSLEAEILSDADKLDAIGAVGVYRAAMYSGEKGRLIDDFMSHFHEKLLTLKDGLYTEEAKRLAEPRQRFMLDFMEQLRRELGFYTNG